MIAGPAERDPAQFGDAARRLRTPRPPTRAGGASLRALILLALAAALTLPPAWLQRSAVADSPELFDLRRFFNGLDRAARGARAALNVEEDVLPLARACYNDPRARPAAQQLLRAALERRWLRGQPGPGLTFVQFERLAAVCPPFEPDRSALLDLLATPEAPRGWRREPALRSWLRKERTGSPGLPWVKRLLAPGLPPDAAARIDRYAFLLGLFSGAASESEAIRLHFRDAAWNLATPAEMAVYLDALRSLEGELTPPDGGDGPRPLNPVEALAVRRDLGRRLLGAVPVAEWSDLGPALGPLARDAEEGPGPFLKRASSALRDGPALRGQAGLAAALTTLAGTSAAREGVVATRGWLRPGDNLEWFAWLFSAGVLPRLHRDDQTGQARVASLADLKSFARVGANAEVVRIARGWYGSDPSVRDRLFSEVIQPMARAFPQAVLAPALQDAYLPAHRAALGLALLSDGELLEPAWKGEDAPARLTLAARLYCRLIDAGRENRGTIARHLGSGSDPGASGPDAVLLDRILTSAFDRLNRPGPPDDRVLAGLDLLAEHLVVCRIRGASLVESRPLRMLDERVSSAVTLALEGLPDRPRGGEIEEAERAAIRRFVHQLRLAIRLSGLAGRTLGSDHDWLAMVRRRLGERVFGLTPGRASEASDRATAAFRAALLAELDPSLRENLAGAAGAEEANRFFDELYVPLAKVPGFLKASRQGSRPGREWPYRAWLRPPGAPARLARERLSRLFAVLATDQDLDAEDAVVELARLDAAARRPGVSVWNIPPGDWFAGRQWSRNAGARVWRRLLDEETPSPEGPWALAEIAQRAVAALDLPVPAGPARPWEWARWAAGLVAAVEWRDAPFLDLAGRPLRGRLSPAARENRAGPAPFALGPVPEEAARRQVDGRLRLALVRTLLERHHRERTEPSSAAGSTPRLIWLAELAALLPNHPDNIARRDLAELAGCHQARQAVYTALDQARRATAPGVDQVAIARAMMLLDVAARSGLPIEPPLERVVAEIRTASRESEAARLRLGELLDEKGRLQRAIGRTPAGDLAADRDAAERRLQALLPSDWRAADRTLFNRTFPDRLQALDGDRVVSLLELERELAGLMSHHERSRRLDQENAAGDLARLVRAFDLVDYTIWYSRSPFDPSLYLAPASSRTGPWYPALAVLGWGDPKLQRQALAVADRLGSEGSREATLLRGMIVQRNETALAVLGRVLDQPDAARLLSFRHTHERRTLNLRLLAETRDVRDLSAESLVSGVFDGALVNLALAQTSRQPSDAALRARLFGIPDGAQQESQARESPDRRSSSRPSVDGIALLAARCRHDPRLSEAMRRGADRFLKEGGRDLLHGAATPEGLLGVVRSIAQRVRASQLEGYRQFYETALTEPRPGGGWVLSREFRGALATVLFRQDLEGQRAFIGTMIGSWRASMLAGARSSAGSRLEQALQDDLGPLAVELATNSRGECLPGRIYPWQAAEELEAEQGTRDTPPEAFFNLAAWWRSLMRSDDPEPIRRWLASAAGKSGDDQDEEDALAAIYRRRCRRESESRAAVLDEQDRALRVAVPVAADQSVWQAVELAWAHGPRVREEYARLLECPRKYDRWAKARGSSLGLSVPERVVHNRWEALRPLWLPAASDRSGSGWEDTAGDSQAWRSRGGAAAYEFLLLLRGLSLTSWPASGRAWLVETVGADRVGAWTLRADASSRLVAASVLRGQYPYRLFPFGGGPEVPAGRATEVVSRLIWPPRRGTSAAIDLAAFVSRKDALMIDLLELISAAAAPGPVVDWFVLGARSFPPFTALQPEQGPHPGTVRVRLDRPGSRVKKLFERLEAQELDQQTLAVLRDSVFWYQIDELNRDGRLKLPEAGWSTWTSAAPPAPETAASSRPAPPLSSSRFPPAPDPPGGDPGPDDAWRRIIAATIEELKAAGLASEGPALAIGVDQAAGSGWTLALGVDELVRRVGEALGRDVRAASGREGIRLVVLRIEPGVSIQTVLRRDGNDLGPSRTFPVVGPWPPWFASRVIPGSTCGDWLGLCLAAVGAIALGWRLRRSRHDRVRGNHCRRWMIISAGSGLLLALAAWTRGPVAGEGPRRGGVVEFLTPCGPDLGPDARAFVVESGARVFDMLVSHVVGMSPLDSGDRWRRRWESAVWAVLGLSSSLDRAGGATSPETRVSGLRYRLVPLGGGSSGAEGGEGLITQGGAAAFRTRIEQLVRVAAHPGGWSLPPPGPGARFRLAFRSGDHGGLITPAITGRTPPAVDVSVWLPGPTRDGNTRRGLTVRARLQRVLDESRAVVAPVVPPSEPRLRYLAASRETFADGSRVEDLDRFSDRPHDLAAEARKLWGGLSELAGPFALEVGSLCAGLYREGSHDTSATVLAAPVSGWGWAFSGTLATASVCALAQARRRGRTWRGCGPFLGQVGGDLAGEAAVAGAVGMCLLALYALICPRFWAYGPVIAGLRWGACAVAAAALLPTTSMTLALVASRIWPGDHCDTLLDTGDPRWEEAAWSLISRFLGFLLLGTAMTWLAIIPVCDGEAGWCRLVLPSTPGATIAAGLGFWWLAAACLVWRSPARSRSDSWREFSP